jgi:hypothetical protein
VKSIEASLSGDFTACDSFAVDLGTDVVSGGFQILATWEGFGALLTDEDPTSNLGNSANSNGTNLYLFAFCFDGSGNPISFPSGVQVSIKVEWTHVPPTIVFT